MAATLQNRHAEARALFERLLSLRNDVGLLAEEYDPHARRQVGNFPQVFSHVALIGTALNLHKVGPAQRESILEAGVALQKAGVIGAGVDVKKSVDDLIDDRYVIVTN